MEIDINQNKISIGDKYQIFVDGIPTYKATRQIFSLLPEIKLFEKNNDRPKMVINKRVSWLKAKYDLTRYDNNIFGFRTVSFWKLHYRCQVGIDQYDIYGHRGRKYSIFKNNSQIAWWDKNAVIWFAGDNYKILANKDVDLILIISFCLVIDNFSEEDHDSNTITFDLGNIGFQVKKFDFTWKPAV